MKPVLACVILGLLAAWPARGDVSAVELNGVAAFGGRQYAVLVLDQNPASLGRGFVLAIGESSYGIRLLAVDLATGSVQIENGGQPQTLRLHSAPGVAATMAAMESAMAAASAQEGPENSASPGGEITPALIPGNPGWGTLPPNPRAAAGAPSQTAAVAAGSPTSAYADSAQAALTALASAAAATPGETASLPDWYQDSLNLEQERIATESQVASGEMTPLPRTPLTPAGTPASLVDNVNGVYSNHNSDFLTQSWSKM